MKDETAPFEDNVFAGHNVTFIHDLYPRAMIADVKILTDEDWEVVPTLVRKRASIGSSVTILAGVTVEEKVLLELGAYSPKMSPQALLSLGIQQRCSDQLRIQLSQT